jgi:hypothetical protein
VIELDERGFRVAVVADELINGRALGFDALAVLERGGWGVIALPPAWYAPALAASLLEQIAEHVQEFHRHGYGIVRIGERDGLDEAIEAVGVPALERIPARDPVQLAAALDERARLVAPRDAAAHQRDRSRRDPGRLDPGRRDPSRG